MIGSMQTPYLCTTREYPDWPMAKVKETPDELAEKVAVALLQMQPDSPAARPPNVPAGRYLSIISRSWSS